MKIAILTGGESSEREVALRSADNVINALKKKYEVAVFDLPKNLPDFLRSYSQYQVAVPVFHGPGGEDGQIQGFLKTLGLPFIFSDVEAHAVGMNKFLTKHLAEKIGLVTPASKILFESPTYHYNYKGPLVIKPLAGGSSIGISIVDSQAKLDEALPEAFKYCDKVLLEKYIEGPEFTVAIIDKAGVSLALPVIEIRSKNNFFDYQSKYDDQLVEELCPAPIDDNSAEELQQQALKIHQALGARHLSRSDFIVAADKIYFLEINTIPGLTNESLVPKAIRAGGEDWDNLLSGWIEEVIAQQGLSK